MRGESTKIHFFVLFLKNFLNHFSFSFNLECINIKIARIWRMKTWAGYQKISMKYCTKIIFSNYLVWKLFFHGNIYTSGLFCSIMYTSCFSQSQHFHKQSIKGSLALFDLNKVSACQKWFISLLHWVRKILSKQKNQMSIRLIETNCKSQLNPVSLSWNLKK